MSSSWTPFQWISVIALAASIINFARVMLVANGASSEKTAQPPVRRLSPRPVAPAATPPSTAPKPLIDPNSLAGGAVGHQRAAAAKTVKIPAVPAKSTDGKTPTELLSPSVSASASAAIPAAAPVSGAALADALSAAPSADEAALADLFGKDKSPTPSVKPSNSSGAEESQTASVRRKASRMEELGFHHGIESGPTAKPNTSSLNKPGESPAQPRSQTAELSSILDRIDKFLADETTPPGGKPTETGTNAGESAPTPAAVTTSAIEKSGTVSGTRASATPPAAVTPAKPAERPGDKATEINKPVADNQKKTPPLWARGDAQDDDLDRQKTDKKTEGEQGQQKLF